MKVNDFQENRLVHSFVDSSLLYMDSAQNQESDARSPSTAADDTIYVFNCIFLQNPMCETMMRFDFDIEASRTYIKEIEQIIRPMDPMILYISRKDVKATVDSVLTERGQDWLDAVIRYHTEQGYGKTQGLTGYDGYIACLIERKNREMDILESLTSEKYVVCTDSENRVFEKQLWTNWIKF